jgi:hypothetical protein
MTSSLVSWSPSVVTFLLFFFSFLFLCLSLSFSPSLSLSLSLSLLHLHVRIETAHVVRLRVVVRDEIGIGDNVSISATKSIEMHSDPLSLSREIASLDTNEESRGRLCVCVRVSISGRETRRKNRLSIQRIEVACRENDVIGVLVNELDLGGVGAAVLVRSDLADEDGLIGVSGLPVA